MHWADRCLQLAGVFLPQERVVLRCELPSSATQSFISHWHTTERKQALWQVASSYTPPKSSPLRSYTVSPVFDHFLSTAAHHLPPCFLLQIQCCSAFRFHQSWEGWPCHFKGQILRPQQVRHLFHLVVTLKYLLHGVRVWYFLSSV